MTEPTCRHRLDGLEPDNLLAFLALLGLLRALEAARPDWRPRAGWEVDRAPLRPFLQLASPAARSEVCEAAVEGLEVFKRALLPFSWPRNRRGKAKRTSICSTHNRFRQLSTRVVQALLVARTRNKSKQQAIWQLRHDLLSSGVVEIPEKGRFELEPTPLKLTTAQMSFVGAMFEAATACRASDIADSLFSHWKYATSGDSLRLAPSEAKRYAYLASDPAPEGAHSERGGTALGALGLVSYALVPGARGARLPGYAGTRQAGVISWPIWSEPCSAGSVVALLASLDAYPSSAHPSIMGKVSCKRFVLDPSTGDYGNVSPGELSWRA